MKFLRCLCVSGCVSPRTHESQNSGDRRDCIYNAIQIFMLHEYDVPKAGIVQSEKRLGDGHF